MMRLSVAVFVLLVGIFLTYSLKPNEATGLSSPLREFPSSIDFWHSEDLPFEDDVVQASGTDEYINREYDGGTAPIELYIGYYKNQSSSDRMHSPKNCLPGSGWEPVSSSKLQIGSVHGLPVIVNEYVVEQGTHRDMVLYWYQSHGRIVASEYWAKFWLVADGLRHQSTDGAMIRIWTTAADGDANAQTRAIDFARHIYPEIATFFPAPGLQMHTKRESSEEYHWGTLSRRASGTAPLDNIRPFFQRIVKAKNLLG